MVNMGQTDEINDDMLEEYTIPTAEKPAFPKMECLNIVTYVSFRNHFFITFS